MSRFLWFTVYKQTVQDP